MLIFLYKKNQNISPLKIIKSNNPNKILYTSSKLIRLTHCYIPVRMGIQVQSLVNVFIRRDSHKP